MDQERIEIKLSKGKGILTLLAALTFVFVSIWLINFADNQTRYDPFFVTVTGYVGMIFFGLAGLYIFYKLFDSKPGLVIDKDGIYDNSSAAAGHFIEWGRITGLRVEQVMSTKFILIDIEKPEQFIDGANGIKKKLMWSTYKVYGTPISISSSTLNCNFEELFQILNRRLI
jgi:hypothetical protein